MRIAPAILAALVLLSTSTSWANVSQYTHHRYTEKEILEGPNTSLSLPGIVYVLTVPNGMWVDDPAGNTKIGSCIVQALENTDDPRRTTGIQRGRAINARVRYTTRCITFALKHAKEEQLHTLHVVVLIKNNPVSVQDR